MKNIVCFGEVLWDVFPTHKTIGGAPLNVALRLNSLENNVSIISRIGKDDNGKNTALHIIDHGINTTNLQIDDFLKTGEVIVTLDETGSATYNIEHPTAWDNIQLTESAKNETEISDAFIYGSLSARDANSKATLLALLDIANYKIFDINLRAPHYNQEILNQLMGYANFIKFNDDEILEIAANLEFKSDAMEAIIEFIAKQTNTATICVTLGSNGAILYYQDTFYYNKGYKVTVKDTVGAGDSFLASLINKLLKGNSPQTSLDFACAVGAIVAGSEGANPKIEQAEIDALITKNIIQ
ncbi:carbohydrate kinase family protein [Winogradskyella endarachnes]|uniref:Carbohydrate kinase n=1 Tax=Winogradskyella endarachnes TaxID=2681965 RepID=A0A6L6U4N6_9FLAO|nr:PfkB family carbohydrate kinase [Winogradskyella endarachnes]MUU77063.1 carbohydrate kinase [Winogradskyella endarachnes]